jgi:hypothetical protein
MKLCFSSLGEFIWEYRQNLRQKVQFFQNHVEKPRLSIVQFTDLFNTLNGLIQPIQG